MKQIYTCPHGCGYKSQRKYDVQRHLNRKRKCTQNAFINAKNDAIESKKGTENRVFGNQEAQGSTENPVFGNQEAQGSTENRVFGNQEAQGSTENPVFGNAETQNLNNTNYFSNQNQTENCTIKGKKVWTCMYCSKTYQHNRSWNRHMRHSCKVLKHKLWGENNRLKKEIEKLKAEKKAETSRITNNTTNNTTNNNTTNNNTMNNNTININNIQLPDGVWTRKLYRVMAHLMAKTKGDRFSPGEIDFYDAFQKTMSVAFYHPESPVYDTVQMLGRKEPWAKHNGKIVRKRKLLKKINQEHYQRLIQMMNADNERFRKELPPAPVIEQWMEVNNEVIRNIKKYDPCEKTMIQNAEEVFRSKSLMGDFNTVVEEVKKADRMDRDIAHSQARDTQRMVNGK
jgi:hypothetical protein